MSTDNKSASQQGANNAIINYNDPWDAVRPDLNANSQLIANLGIEFEHWAAIPDPLGMNTPNDVRQYDREEFVKNEQFIHDNGLLYYYIGNVFGVFTSNSKDLRQIAPGYYNESGAVVTFNQYYKGTSKKTSFSEFDKLIPVIPKDEFWTQNFERLTHNPAGVDRLQFLATEIEMIVDSNHKIYSENVDYVLEKGIIKWLPNGSRPGIDRETGTGTVISVRYKYFPTFYVKQMIRDIRISQTIDPESGDVKIKRGPISAQVQIDWVFLDNNTNNPNYSAQDAVLEASDTPNVGRR